MFLKCRKILTKCNTPLGAIYFAFFLFEGNVCLFIYFVYFVVVYILLCFCLGALFICFVYFVVFVFVQEREQKRREAAVVFPWDFLSRDSKRYYKKTNFKTRSNNYKIS